MTRKMLLMWRLMFWIGYEMKQNRQNSAFVIIILLFVGLACSGSSTDKSDENASKVERGRLKFVKNATALSIGENPIFRDVKYHFYGNGKEWSPKDDANFADKMNWCDTSPNPKVEILRCFGNLSEDYSTTYILRMKGDEVDVQKLDEGVGSVWINDDGRWLLFRKFFFNVETGEKIEVKGMLWADDKNASAPVIYVIGVSPDMKTVVAMPNNSPKKEGNEEFLSLKIIDTESGKVENKRASFTKYPWLKDYKEPKNDIQPSPEPQRNFVWKKDENGKDYLIIPELLMEKIEKR